MCVVLAPTAPFADMVMMPVEADAVFMTVMAADHGAGHAADDGAVIGSHHRHEHRVCFYRHHHHVCEWRRWR